MAWPSGAGSGGTYMYSNFSVKNLRGKRCAIKARCRTSGIESSDINISVRIKWTLSNGTDYSSPQIRGASIASSVDGSGYLYCEATVPAGASFANVEFGATLTTSPSEAGYVDFGEVAVYELPQHPLIGTKSSKLPRPCVETATALTLTIADDIVLVDATSGPVTITLPPSGNTLFGLNPSYGGVVGAEGLGYTIIKTDSSGNAVTVAAQSPDTINGGASVQITSQNGSVYAHAAKYGKYFTI